MTTWNHTPNYRAGEQCDGNSAQTPVGFLWGENGRVWQDGRGGRKLLFTIDTN